MYTHLQRDQSRPPVTLATLARMKADGEKIACLTCYDASFAVLLDAADVDVVLVGDSLGMVIQGHHTTVPVTMDHMAYHSAAVARGLHRQFLITDLPFMSYPSKDLALEHSVRLMQEGGAQMVKLESGGKQTEIVELAARFSGPRAAGDEPAKSIDIESPATVISTATVSGSSVTPSLSSVSWKR